MIHYSIIIPHKNIPDLLSRCLASIPDTGKFQIIVVDDDSDPAKVDFENFPGLNKPNTEIHFTKEGKGAGYARNIGLEHAKGKWLLFADADDFFNDCFEQSILQYFNSKADIIYFSATSIDNETRRAGYRHQGTERAVKYYNPNDKNSVDKVKYSNREPWARMFNHDFIKKNKIIFDEVLVGNDAGFVLKAGHLAKHIAVNANPIYCVTFRRDSLTFADNEMAFDNRFKAALFINDYLIYYDKETLSIKDHLIEGRKYGLIKVFKMIFLAKKYIQYRIRYRLRYLSL